MSEVKLFLKGLLQDKSGKYSHARIISTFVAIAATVFIWKLILLGGMGVEYFVAYLAYGTGTQTLNKFLDGKKSKDIDT